MKIKLPAFFIFLALIFFVRTTEIRAQYYNADSLENILNQVSELEKISYYYALTDYYIYNAPQKAIRLANEFLILAEKHDSTHIIDHCYQILGEAYYLQENLDQSLEYFKQLLQLRLNGKEDSNIAGAYNNLGIVHRAKEEYAQAIEYYQKALEINNRINDINGISSVNNNLGVLHEYLNLFSKARDYYSKSLEIELQLNDLEGISTSYLNLGGIHYKLRNYKQAIEFCNKSIAICDSLNYQHSLELNYEILYQTYKKLNNLGQALNYLELYNQLKQERVNEEVSSQLAELEIKYQSDKQKQEIGKLQLERKQKQRLSRIYLIALLIFSGQAIFLLIINKKRRKINNSLKQINAEVMQQKEEIEAQRDEIEAQRDEIRRQKDISDFQTNQILKQNKDIKDSIEYAKHIQIALFPDKISLQVILKHGFCLFKPKDIVSGDFYWVTQIENKSVIVASDCTGHGVPGAFMSIIGINFLNEIVNENLVLTPAEILNQLRKKVIKTMVHANKIEESKDGMDISLIVIDYDRMELEFAGAYNHLYYIRDHMLEVIKADRMPIGISEKTMMPFTNHKIKIQSGDQFYMFTDGYADQFGGPLKKKFRVGALRELLLEIHEKDMNEQKRLLHENFINWKGKQQQVDDVLAIGIRI